MKETLREKLKDEIERAREKLKENEREMNAAIADVSLEEDREERTDEENSEIDKVEVRFSRRKTKLEADIEFRKDWLEYGRKPNRDDYGKAHVWKIPPPLTEDAAGLVNVGYKQDLLGRLISDSKKELLKETKTIDKRKRATETQRLTRALKYLKEDKWGLFVKTLNSIDSSLLASQSREKIQYVKLLIGKGRSREEIVKSLIEWKPKKTAGTRQKRSTTPEWMLMSEEERVREIMKSHRKLTSSYHGALFFLALLFGAILWVVLRRAISKPEQPLPEAPTGIGHISSFQSTGVRK